MGKKGLPTEKYVSNRVLYEMLCASRGEIAQKLAYLMEYSKKTQNEELLKAVKEIVVKYGSERIEKKAQSESEFVMILIFDKNSKEYDLRKIVDKLYKDYGINENNENENS